MQQFRWWELFPDASLLEEQPGDADYLRFVSVLRSDDYRTVLVYLPAGTSVELRNPQRLAYRLRWFDSVANCFKTDATATDQNRILLDPSQKQDTVVVLEA